MKFLKIIFSFLLLSALFSCVNDNEVGGGAPSPKPVNDESLVRVYIGMRPIKSRAAIIGSVGAEAESMVKNVAVGIYGNDGTSKYITEVVPKENLFTLSVPNIEAGDSIFLAINVPSGLFKGASKKKDFKNRTMSIDQAMITDAADNTVANPETMPMFGASALSTVSGKENEFQAEVPVNHLLAKITLNSLQSVLTGDATFTPTEIFLKNVPAWLDFYPATSATVHDYLFYTNDTWYTGQSDAETNSFKSYLGTSKTLGFTPDNATLSSTATTWSNSSPVLTLYTMPNTSDNPTLLVIRGNYKPDGSTEVKDVFYSMFINYNTGKYETPNGGNAKEVYPNYNYKIDVIIKNEGKTKPDEPDDPDDNIEYFETVTEDYTFGTYQGMYSGYVDRTEEKWNQSHNDSNKNNSGVPYDSLTTSVEDYRF